MEGSFCSLGAHLFTRGLTLQKIETIQMFICLTLAFQVSVSYSCYVFPPGKNNPCEGVECEYGATCVSTKDGIDKRCQCPKECFDYGDSTGSTPVCGNNGKDYNNYCELRRDSCEHMQEIKVKYYGKCDPCAGIKCEGQEVCQLDDERKPVCKCETSCDPVIAPVCGSDGQTYSNECMLRQQACKLERDITVLYEGKCRDYIPEDMGPCRDVHCKNDAECIVREGRPICECPTCISEPFDPMCGDDGVSYDNDCERRQENCKMNKNTQVEHRGRCMSCKNNQSVCKFYSMCESGDGLHRCVCPSDCTQTYSKVCGTDGKTYDSECELRVASCKNKMHIYIASFGDCVDCNGVQCKYGSECVQGQCVCPQICPKEHAPVCASDGNTYKTKCEMRKEACRLNRDLKMVRSGSCNDDQLSGSGEGSGTDCEESMCEQYGGTCYLDMDGISRCSCSFSCDAIRSPVCGSNSVTYGNKCELQKAACEQQKQIIVQSMDSCDDMDEVLCDGLSPVLNAANGIPYRCTGGHDCPAGSYCHLQFGKCCNEDQCQCNPIGSVSVACNSGTRQCTCKPGVGGQHCDRCLPGYWGLRLIQEEGNPGCIPCNCHPVGASRADCQQNTGRCMCNNGFDGHKCGRCKDSGMSAGDMGCDGDVLTLGPTDVPFTPRSRKTTRHIQASNYMTPKKPSPTPRSTLHVDFSKYGRIGDLCLEDSYCFIPHSHCYLALCQCDDGYIPTYENTQCSKVVDESTNGLIPEEINTCTLNPCLHSGVCKLDDNLGYRCLCSLGRTGNICKKSTSFTTPSFSGSSYLSLQPLGNITHNFYLDIAFHTFNKDGILLYSSQNEDGTGQFISIAISGGFVEFRFDTGKGPKQIRHPYELTKDRYHQVIAKKMGQSAMLIVDNMEPVAAVTIASDQFQDLSGGLYLGYLPQNLSFLSEKVGVNLGFVGCVQSLTAGHMDMARIYNLDYPSSSSQILDGLDVGPCEENPCQSLPCKNGATCVMLNKDIYQCLCLKAYTGSDCEAPIDICTNSPCHPSATCSLGESGEILCNCPETREGQYCEYEKLAEIEVPEFHGDSYLVLPLSDNLSTQTSIELWFLTKSVNGMLLYASQYIGGQGDFLSLNIIDRYVELRFDLGDSPVIIRSSTRLKLDRWHKVTVKRTSKQAELILDDGLPSDGTSQGTLTGLQFTGSLYVGGYKEKKDLPVGAQITDRFIGVLQRIYINGKLIEEPMSSSLDIYHVTQYSGMPCQINPCMNGGVCVPKLDRVDCKCPKRFIGQLCEKIAENMETSLPVRFDGGTYLQYYNEITSSHQAQKLNKYQFRFRTHQSNGLMIFQGQGPSVNSDYIALVVSDGFVELGYNLGKQNANNILRARSSVFVSDGEWHTVYAERDLRHGSLQVDKETIKTTVSENGATQLDTDGMLWIGGHPDLPVGLPTDYYKGFKGCLGFVFILDKQLHLYNHRNGIGSIMEFCHL